MKNSVRCRSVRFGWYISQSSELLLRTILCGCDDNRSDHTQVPIDFSQKLMNHFGIAHDLFLSIYLLASVRWSAAYYSHIVWLYLIIRACIWYVACVVVLFFLFLPLLLRLFFWLLLLCGRWSVYAKYSLCIFKQDYMN